MTDNEKCFPDTVENPYRGAAPPESMTLIGTAKPFTLDIPFDGGCHPDFDPDNPKEVKEMHEGSYQLTVSLRMDTDNNVEWAAEFFEYVLTQALAEQIVADGQQEGTMLDHIEGVPTFRSEFVAYENGTKIETVTSRKIEVPVTA